MANSKIQLGSLEFEDIKQSIIDFMKTNRTGSAVALNDYDFDASALQTLVEILAYNTLYYGHYSNMIANEMFLDTAQKAQSLISLVKPLGYVVPGYSSASAEIRILSGGAYRNIPKYSSFIGQNGDGVSYVFYTKEEYDLDDQGKGNLIIYEGKTFVSKEVTLGENNKIFLTGTDIDMSTITVEVRPALSSAWEEWTLASNIEYNLDSGSKVYWLERSEYGFFLVFGGNAPGYNTSVGQVPNDNFGSIRVKYLISSGEKGNGVSSFKYNNLYDSDEDLHDNHQIVNISSSSEGRNDPDLDAIRFWAPKWFAAQDRAITKEDCKSVLAGHGFASDTTTVWGGEEMDPPFYGRLFVSLIVDIDEADTATQAISALKEKTCVTILPEYISAEYYDSEVEGLIAYSVGDTEKTMSQMRSQAIALIDNLYGTLKFNNNFNIQSIINGLINLDSAYRVGEDNFTFNLKLNRKINSTGTIKFFNAIDESPDSGHSVWTDAISDNTLSDSEIYLEDVSGIIIAYRVQDGLKVIVSENVGSVNYEKGTIKMKNISNQDYGIYMQPKNKLILNSPENMVLRINPNITVIAE